MDRFLQTFFNPVVMAQYTPDIIAGVWVTLQIAAAVIVAGIAGGLTLACLRSYRIRALNFFIICYADIFRALPPLVVILILYFGFPSIGIQLSGPMVLFLVLAATLAAFAEEIFWAGFSSVEKGQWEAGIATGLGFTRTLAYVALPQAVRLAIPPLVNRVLAITKMTALGSAIGVSEILSSATTAQSFSGSATPLTMSVVAYLVIFLPMVVVARWLESRTAWKKR
ncbi:amino acid ABC transporter permease [Aliirhizobium cellulosilyticum]|uniref:Polar amino acid transport system permease protein n=1 Tax=Aliirhizobium cellulosilyticum TaxID=393664 RepID=A0A7W6XAT1_9HYPH|nr:ABC transporter permease subunit [Rhizobium cellulosilyticum]MBB4349764.1 polar amino acid transport system permease protein [Rhizobium cellulosilyticum]MBB4412015.1 polar amino acid transport system permease protein [Rhizobium cellulosilyticum]MBB4446647.1 polar amino acid transport system permease protein [Rhizobium cellulosilyticum]